MTTGFSFSKLWFACDEPERPTDSYVLWHYGGDCAGCRIKAELVCCQNPELRRLYVMKSVLGEAVDA